MKRNAKARVAIIYGGQSSEHEVSLLSAASVMEFLDTSRYEIIPIGIDKQGQWFINEVGKVYFPHSKQRLQIKANNSSLMTWQNQNKEVQQLNGRALPFDVAFPVVHGQLCEDGCLQGLLELINVPYVGAGVLASAVGMDKDVSKRLIKAADIATPNYIVLKENNGLDWKLLAHNVEKKLGFPVFIKPAHLGSSVGIHKVDSASAMMQCIKNGFAYDNKLLIEQAVEAAEVELSVLENSHYGAPPLVSMPGEIQVAPHHKFYTYQAKYEDPQGANLQIPANLTDKQVRLTQQVASRIFQNLECEGMARVDLFVDRKSDTVLFNEINTLPGFTQISMYSKLWEASGLPYSELLTQLIELAFARHRRKKPINP